MREFVLMTDTDTGGAPGSGAADDLGVRVIAGAVAALGAD
jgi:hypothetical protein